MKFMLMLYADQQAPPPAAGDSLYQRMYAYREALARAGAFVASAPFAPSDQARTTRPDGEELQVHDGPYAETREQIGGYFVIDVLDMDAAIDWARQCPSARSSPIEIRPYLAGF